MKSDLVKDYAKRFPNTPTRTLAKKIYNDNVALWSNVEAARSLLRLVRGQGGKKQQEQADPAYFKKGKINPFDKIPEGLTAYADWQAMELEGEKFLLIADAHIPYHDKGSLSMALDYGRKREVDTILILGDFIDFYSCSFWDTDPRRRNFQEEVKAAHSILETIRQQFPKARIIYKLGNHEERYERYMRVKAPELLGYEAFEFAQIIKADKFDLEMVGDKRIIKIGRLHCVHGHEFWKGATNPVNPARGLYLRGKEIAVCAHYHQTSNHTEKSMSEYVVSCWSIGALCDMHPDYSPINKWNHGFAIVERDSEFQLDNYKIINGRVYHA